MIRRAGVLALLVALLGCTKHNGALQSSTSLRAVANEATRLDEAVEVLYREGKLREAVPLAERSLLLRETALGPKHPDVADSLINLALLHKTQGSYAMAEPLCLRALNIQESSLGSMHLSIATSLNNLAGIYVAQNAYERAEPLLLRALEIREKAQGPDHPEVSNILNNLAELHRLSGEYAKAEPLYLRALVIVEQMLGSKHPDVAISLNNLATLYWTQGAYAKAEPLYIRALDIMERALGPTHPDVAIGLNNLARLYQSQGASARAEPLYIRALDIKEKVLGPMHLAVATALNNLAEIIHEQGAYARAEPLYLRALDISERTLGMAHPDVAITLNNLALLYQDQGMYAQGEPLLVRALRIMEKALGPMHPDVATSLSNLAIHYRDQGAYTEAEPLYIRALQIRETAFGAMHPDVATALDNLGSFYFAQHESETAESLHINVLENLYQARTNYARAESLHTRALAIREKVLGPQHPDVAASLNNLANLHRAQNAYSSAELLYRRSLEIRQKVLGKMHPDVASSLNSLARVLRAQGSHASAVPLLARAAEIREAHLRVEIAPLSAPRKRALMALQWGETESLVSQHADSMPGSVRALELALTTVLRRKSRVLDSLADHQSTLRAHLDPALRDKLAQLAEASAQLSSRLHTPFDARTPERSVSEIATLRARMDELESTLNTASAEFHTNVESVTLGKIQAALPHGSALVEIVRHRRFDARQAQSPWRETRYVAYILPWQGSPQWVALGEAAAIDARLDAALGAMRGDSGAAGARAALRRLDALVYAPIRARLAGISHVILSPDGKLNLVPFEALVDPQGRHELELRLVSYVTSGRDLLRLAARRAPQSPATIVADPDYGSGTRFGRIAGAGAEADEIRIRLPGAKVLMGAQATKTALAAVKGPAVLHIATHGFYAREGAAAPARVPTGIERGMSVDSAIPLPSTEDPADALDRAGLALAGANTRPDGIVSAREIAGFDWWGTQLVVLSACETGVGAVPSGEGVYGLRRALVLAGARSQVVSLWNVSDSSAPVLMREFYGELARGTGRAEALRRAKLHLVRQQRFAHPYYWAAFVLAGDWTPLDEDSMRRREPGR